MIAVLDNIRSLHNVGSIFRTADGAGVKKIILTGITPLPVDRLGNPREQLTKVSLGAEKYVSWEHKRSASYAVDRLKNQGYQIIVLERAKRAVPYWDYKLPSEGISKIALVVGHEIKGVSEAVIRRADCILEIPMQGKKESLNVAVAFGIVVFHILTLQNLKLN